MKEIEKPSLVIDEISPDGRYGKFVWEPLERGYGITLGNSLRRVLLSSLSGMAVTGIKIDGVLHRGGTGRRRRYRFKHQSLVLQGEPG